MRLSWQFLFIFLFMTQVVSAQVDETSEPMPLIGISDDTVENIVLLGSDTSNPQNSGRTDVILIVSVNYTHKSIAFLSVPRDLYVFVPGWKTQRINTAYAHGETIQAGQGPQMLFDTIRFNLGIQIDHYARVDFNDFKEIIDAVGGIDLAVDCAIEDWRLREPGLDPNDESSWEIYTLPIGLHHMNGDLALWYVRSRRTSSDLDRGKRQQEMLRALWRHTRALGILDQITEIWPQVAEIVETDLALTDILRLVSSVQAWGNDFRLSSYIFELNKEVIPQISPEGESVLVPQRDNIREFMVNFAIPPTDYQIDTAAPHVLITNAGSRLDMPRIVADMLAWHGFRVSLADDEVDRQQLTKIYDYTGQVKGGRASQISGALGIPIESIVRQPSPNRQYDFEVVIGSSYYPCTRNVIPPASTS